VRKTPSKSDWKDGFLFLGNELVLDFLNTRPVQNGKVLEMLPDFDALLRWFLAADLLSSEEVSRLQNRWNGTPEAQKTTETLQDLRERLRDEVLAWEQGRAIRRSTIEELNRLMAEHPMRTRLTSKGGVHSTQLWFEPGQPEDLFAPLAYSAVTLFADVDRRRVRKCDQCVLHFHDTSKKGTRRWCSMQLCGNRLKVAAYAARQHRRARIMVR
jgi:predicted RNA-binding Zn ribbon-like protein